MGSAGRRLGRHLLRRAFVGVILCLLLFWPDVWADNDHHYHGYNSKNNGAQWVDDAWWDSETRLFDCLVASKAELVVIVRSRREHFARRAAIRRSWGNTTVFPPGKACVLFAVASDAGRPPRGAATTEPKVTKAPPSSEFRGDANDDVDANAGNVGVG